MLVTCHICVSHLAIVFVIILIPGPLAVNKFSLDKFRNVVILKDHFEQLIFFSPVCGGIPCTFFFQSDDLKCCFLCIGKLRNCCFCFLCCRLKSLRFLLNCCKICCGCRCLGTCCRNCCIISCLCRLKLVQRCIVFGYFAVISCFGSLIRFLCIAYNTSCLIVSILRILNVCCRINSGLCFIKCVLCFLLLFLCIIRNCICLICFLICLFKSCIGFCCGI